MDQHNLIMRYALLGTPMDACERTVENQEIQDYTDPAP